MTRDLRTRTSDLPLGEAIEETQEQRDRGEMARFISDLDRCEHGRHIGDVCGDCGGDSKGNPLAREKGDDWKLPALVYDADGRGGVVLGYDISGDPYVLIDKPDRGYPHVRVFNLRKGRFW